MQIKRTIKGHEFSVQLRAVERAGQLANGAPAYTAHVTIYRDGRDIGSARWDGEDFSHGPATMADLGDSEDVYRELAVAIRERLATLPMETRADEATASMQRVTFAPGLGGDELRRMAVYARGFGDSGVSPWGAAWRALADALDAAAERAEAGNAPASPPAESPAEMTDARRRDLFHVALWDSAKHDFSGAWPSDLSDGGAYLVEQRLAYRANFCGRLHLAPKGRELIASMQAGNAPEAP